MSNFGTLRNVNFKRLKRLVLYLEDHQTIFLAHVSIKKKTIKKIKFFTKILR